MKAITKEVVIFDASALEQLFAETQEKLFYTAFGMVKCQEKAADIVQDIFLKAIERGVFDGGVKNIPAYLFRMVRNECIDVLSADKKVTVDNDAVSRGSPDDADPCLLHFDVVSEDDQIAEVQSLIESELTASELAVFKLKRQGLSRREMAEELGISEATVHSHVTSSKRKLQKIRQLILG